MGVEATRIAEVEGELRERGLIGDGRGLHGEAGEGLPPGEGRGLASGEDMGLPPGEDRALSSAEDRELPSGGASDSRRPGSRRPIRSSALAATSCRRCSPTTAASGSRR